MSALSHGGDVVRVAREIGIPAERILDFSANVNPMGVPAVAIELLEHVVHDRRVLSQYPDPEAWHLRQALSARLDIPAANILVGAGADALIHAAVRAVEPRRCIIPIPAFSEYERACRAYGCALHRIRLGPDAGFALSARDLRLVEPGDLVVLNNPHNPTGMGVSRAEMLERIQIIRSAGAVVLADEAFIDYVPEAAITREAALDSVVISVRSLTKFFGCPGLRVGYAVAAAEMIRRLSAQLPAWPVTTLALGALTAALEDGEYVRATLENNRRAKEALVESIASLGCRVFPPAANFVLFEIPHGFSASDIREGLIRKHGILVRDCDSFDGLERGRYLRVAVRREDENALLVEALARTITEKTCRQHT